MKRRFFAIAIALLLVLSLFGCAKPAANETSSVESTPEVVVAGGLDATPAAQMSGEGGLDIKILLEQDDDMKNNYTLIAVNDAAPFKDADGKAVSGVAVNTIGAKALIDWMLSDEAGQLISGYGVSQYGEALFTLSPDKAVSKAQIPEATDATRTIRLSTTTSVNDSGLLTYLLPMFEAKYGYTVEVSSAGTGKAIAAATMGNADLILVHSKSQEEKFVADGFAKVLEGYSTERLTLCWLARRTTRQRLPKPRTLRMRLRVSRKASSRSFPAGIRAEHTPRRSLSGRSRWASPRTRRALPPIASGISPATPVWASA